jgi:hypothetical protein
MHYSAVTAQWLDAVLAEGGTTTDAKVVSVHAETIGTGQVGENVRFRLGWDKPGRDQLASVVGKFPSPDPTSRAAAAATMTYQREVGFYRDLRAKVGVRTPEIYYVGEDLGANDFTLIMEDVSPAQVGDQLTGCEPERALQVVSAAADLHASTWDSETLLEKLSWIGPKTPEVLERTAGLYNATFAGFSQRYSDQLTVSEIEMGRWLGSNLAAVLTGHEVPRCLVHGDFRLDNMLFGDGDVSPSLVVVDWQTATSGFGAVDVAYFVGAGLLGDDRRQNEKALFDHYLARLSGHGIVVDANDLWRSYVLGSASGYVMAVIASQIVGQTERGDEMFRAMASRHCAQMNDLDLPSMVS